VTTSKTLPARPSLESLRKQARKLLRDAAAGDAAAVARARTHLSNAEPPLTQRAAQLVIAREYGFAGWQDLTAEVSRRLGSGVEWAASQAQRLIHDNDVEGLKTLLSEYPALLSWRGVDGDGDAGLLGFATGAFADSFDPAREQTFTRPACAALLIDAGAVVMPSVCEGILDARARGLLQLFRSKGLLPRTLEFLAALGDIDAVRAELAAIGDDPAIVNAAFMRACSFEHEGVARLILERATSIDAELGRRVDASGGALAFIRSIIDNRSHHFSHADAPWQVFVIQKIKRAVHDDDMATFVEMLRREPWLVGDAFVEFQAELVGQAALQDRGPFIDALIDLDPALVRRRPPPPSQAIEFALTYAHTHLMPRLTRIWSLPDDLPHAAGMGNLARVKRWFDESSGAPALGDLSRHYPCNDARARGHLRWYQPTAQQILDTALAFAVVNGHFEVADFLLGHGADINTRWNSHEPASILHHLVFEENYDSMRFLIDRGIDMTIRDYRWNSTARGWALYGKQDEQMARWLEDAERQRAGRS
jgi:hypothetical protein